VKKILVVDDEPDIVESLQVVLSKEYETVPASNGREALERAGEMRPDLILLDVMMPTMDGFQACREIKKNASTRDIPVLLLTALHDTDNKVKGLDAGADDFIGKPFNEVELLARVRAFLRTKELHDELQRSFARLQELERMRDALTHMIVHDLKAPLTSIKGGLSISLEASKSGPLEPGHFKLLRNAEVSADRALDLIQDILDVSRMEEARLPLKKQPIDLGAVVRSCVASMEPLAEASEIKLAAKIPSGLPPLPADETLLQRVLVNLVSNSLKFTPAGGTVAITVTRSAESVDIGIEDSGIGIPKEHLERIFDKFFQSGAINTGRKGQGLGLAFCRLAVERMGGKIWAERREPGSRFVIRMAL